MADEFHGDGDPTHLLIARAAATDPDGESIEIRVGWASCPLDDAVVDYLRRIIFAYEDAFGRPPERTAVVVLPWVCELNDDC